MGSPTIPDPSQAATQGMLADVANYPFKYQIDALAKMGGKATIGGKVYDFSGLGDAATQGKVSDQMAQAILDIQKNYGADFVKQRLKDLQQADPEGYAARQDVFQKVMDFADRQPDQKLPQELQDNMLGLLSESGKLNDRELEQTQQGVRGSQLHRGIYLGNAPASQEASAIVGAEEGKRTAIQDESQKYSSLGITPEDYNYRQVQDSLKKLSDFQGGRTPTASFGSLAGAGGSAAPFTTTGNVNAMTDPNGVMNALNWQNQLNAGNAAWGNSQSNPFMAGLSTAASGLKTASNLGWNPWGAGSRGTEMNPAMVTGWNFGGNGGGAAWGGDYNNAGSYVGG